MKVKNIVFNIFIVLVLLISSFVGFVIVSKTKVFAVETGSMSPCLSVGDVVFIKKVSADELEVGDVIAVYYSDGSGVFTHRITRLDGDKKLVYTKGDANAAEDELPSQYDKIIGRLWFSIPFVGYMSLKFNGTAVLLVIAGVAVLLFVVGALLDRVKSDSIQKKKQ